MGFQRTKGIVFTVREWDEGCGLMYELYLRYGTGELHRTLSNQPSFGPELVGKWAKIPRIPVQCKGVDRYGSSLREVANFPRSVSNHRCKCLGRVSLLSAKGSPFGRIRVLPHIPL